MIDRSSMAPTSPFSWGSSATPWRYSMSFTLLPSCHGTRVPLASESHSFITQQNSNFLIDGCLVRASAICSVLGMCWTLSLWVSPFWWYRHNHLVWRIFDMIRLHWCSSFMFALAIVLTFWGNLADWLFSVWKLTNSFKGLCLFVCL